MPRTADEWWASLPLGRRDQIFQWVEKHPPTGEIDGQTDLFDIVDLPFPGAAE